MSDNPQYGSASFFPLSGVRVVRLTGRDAIVFAQSQFMNDVVLLDDHRWHWNGWLDPKGRVRALFALLRVDAETLALVTTASASTLDAELGRFVFRSKVRIDAPAWTVLGAMKRPVAALGAEAAVDQERIELDFSGDAGARTLWLGTSADGAAAPPARTSEEARGDQARWHSLDLVHGFPALPNVSLEAWTPQQLSLERLGAFSVRKGCYPGQEIVARTHFIGRAKRGLARIGGTRLGPGDALSDAEGRAVGQVVCAAGDDALAVVPLEPADLELFAAGVPVHRRILAGGLQR